MAVELRPATITNSAVTFVSFCAIYRDTWNLRIAIPIGVMRVFALNVHIFGLNLRVGVNCIGPDTRVNAACVGYGGSLA